MKILDWLFKRASAPNGEAQSPPVASGQWELLLLSEFSTTRNRERIIRDPRWAAALRAEPLKVIDKLCAQGLLAEADLGARLREKFKVPDLKQLLRERRLPVSGNKQALIDRLIEADRDGARAAAEDIVVLQCTEAGCDVVEPFMRARENAYRAAEDLSLDAIKQGEFKRAIEIVNRYTASQLFLPNPIGIPVDTDRKFQTLQTISTGRPKILSRLNDAQLSAVRVATAMSALWNSRSAKSWLPKEFKTEPFDAEVAARMLHFYANSQYELSRATGIGVNRVQILSAGDADTCNSCREISGRTYSISEAPELPYGQCTCEEGCRCMYLPLLPDDIPQPGPVPRNPLFQASLLPEAGDLNDRLRRGEISRAKYDAELEDLARRHGLV
jgi:hypothetical protein